MDHMLQMFLSSLSNWAISALKDECRRHGIDSSGEKSLLLLRLQQFYENKFTAQQMAQSQQLQSPAAPDNRYTSTAADHTSGTADLSHTRSIERHVAYYQTTADELPRPQSDDIYAHQRQTQLSPAASSLNLSIDTSLPQQSVIQMESSASSTPSSLPLISADRQFFITQRRQPVTSHSGLLAADIPAYSTQQCPGTPIAPGWSSSHQYASVLPTTSLHRPGFPAPAHPSFSHQAPGHTQPGFPAPAHPSFSHQAPGHTQPGFPAPAHLGFSHQMPGHTQPGFPASAHQNFSQQMPGHTQPGFPAPVTSSFSSEVMLPPPESFNTPLNSSSSVSNTRTPSTAFFSTRSADYVHPNVTVRRTHVGHAYSHNPNVHFASPDVTSIHSASLSYNRGGHNSCVASNISVAGTSQTIPASVAMQCNPKSTADQFNVFPNSVYQTRPKVSSLAQPISGGHNSNELLSPLSVHLSHTDNPLPIQAHQYSSQHTPLVTAAPIQGNMRTINRELSSPYYHQTTPQSQQSPSQTLFTQLPNAHSTQRQLQASPSDEMSALEHKLKVLKMQEEIRNTQHRLNLPPGCTYGSTLPGQSRDDSNSEIQTMISYVKRSLDISSTPTAKPMIFTGDPLHYPTWRASFDLLVSEKDIAQAQKLTILLSHVSGDAKEWIEYYIMSDSDTVFDDAMKALEENFGNPFEVADAFRDKLESWPKIAGSDSKGLKKYAQFLKQCKHAMFSNEHLSDLDNPRQFKNVVSCLPIFLVQRWSREAGRNKMKTKKNPTFAEYADFVMDEAMLACDKTTSYHALSGMKEAKQQSKKEDPKRMSNKAVTHTTNASNTPNPVKSKQLEPVKPSLHCNHCQNTNSHTTVDCRKLSKMSNSDQQSFMKRESLCFLCLEKNHSKLECTADVKCGKCSGKHATCLHRKPSDKPPSFNQADSTQTNSAKQAVAHSIHSKSASSQQVTTMTVPVYISSPEDPTNETLIYALIDGGSNKSYIEQEVCDSLFTSKVKRKLRVSTITSQDQISWCDCISNLRVRGLGTPDSEVISVEKLYSLDSIPANKQHIPTQDTASKWPHLKGIRDKLSPLQSCEVSMIIGFPCSIASLPLETVKCEEDKTLPYAVRTILGWSIIGGQDMDENSNISHKISSVDITNEQVLKLLEEDIAVPHNKQPMSQNDLKFLDIMENSIKQDNKGFYTMPLPFKQRPDMPDNRAYAMSRFKGLERKLNANPELKSKFKEFMEDIVSKGEAEEVKEPWKSGWYIPHHGVFHPHKPGKLRVVYDCSSSFKGHSLNKNLLQGPDLNNSLAGLLCRFRKERIAVTCDVRKMFHQFRVSEADRQYLRFLWYRDGTSDITDFHMNVHLFGATSSPSCAIYGMQKIASDYSTQYPVAAQFVKENFYVDDGLASVASPSEAIQLMRDARDMLSNGNLVLHKFLSNNDQVAKELGCDGPATKVIANDQDLDRTLGLCWNVHDDAFTFLEVPVKPPTRRGVLSTVASLFDPLGFLAPFSLTGKLLLQQLCYDKVDWDDQLDVNHMRTWTQWTNNLKDLSSLNISRCYMDPGLSLPYTVELHNFSDACETGYGACSYLRLINRTTNQTSVSLVLGKSRVAPKKYVSMPRLELQAATLAVKCNDFLRDQLHYDNMTSYFWTDSKAVLGYVSNEVRKFHVFVYNRVQRIRDSSSAEQWNYVNTTENPADVVSRGCYLPDIPHSWQHGPAFLADAQFTPDVSARKEYKLNPDDPEIKTVFTHTASAEIDENWLLSILREFSNWKKVIRIMEHVGRFISKARKQGANTHSAFDSLVKAIQSDHFQEEIKLLSKGQKIGKDSSLHSLDPFLDEQNMLRVGGRLTNSLSSFETRHPVALPSKELLTKAYIRYKHVEAAHQGRNTTINTIRSSGVHVVGGIKTVSSVIHNCVKCKRLRGSPLGQKMADLPASRAEPSPPFTHTGMDVFGPFLVKDYRKEVKRYGLLLTCMASRAVHLELLDDLSTDSFINSMRCFLAIRGPVHTFYSDRGTNFVGAANEFQQGINALSSEEIKGFLESQQCSFEFNTPYASHMGGSWERMIRTVRGVLQGILIESNSSRLSSSSLRTLFYECMHIVNSRPLTTQQLTTDSTIEPQPLTPNCLLTMKTQPLKPPPGKFEEAHLYSRKCWKRVQFLCEQFWSRWKPEYLQSLQKRTKWTEEHPNFEEGDVVLLKDKDLARGEWKMARVLKVTPSKDNLVRKVEIQTATTGQVYQRPAHSLILLVRSNVK